MKERPILFSAEMVKALLAGRKTQTRRLVKPQPPEGCTVGWSTFSGEDRIECRSYAIPHQSFIKVPYGKKGDRLWVKETFQRCENCGVINYRATANEHGKVCQGCDEFLTLWKPSIFMPRKLSRLTLEIKTIRVERLQDISEADAEAEGCCVALNGCDDDFARTCYRKLWEKINGTGSWDKNEWVWVIEFNRIEQETTAKISDNSRNSRKTSAPHL